MTAPHVLHPDVERWLDNLRQRNRTADTLRTYRTTMSRFHPDPVHATLDEVDAWWTAQDHLAVKTRNRVLSCVRSFYTWAIRFDLLDKDPTRRLDPPKVGTRLPRPMGRTDFMAVLAQCDKDAAPDMRRAVCLGGYAGLRVHEAAALSWANVDQETRRLFIRGKGDKDRLVGLSPLLLDELLPDTGGNVVTGTPTAYTADALQRRVNRLIDRAGVDGTYHKLRARYATLGLEHTGNLLAVSRALGHSSTATTALYAATSDNDLDLIAQAAIR